VEFPFGAFFEKNLQDGKLISPAISAQYLTWLLLQTTDEEFSQKKHDIYDPTHHYDWHRKTLPSPY
jgi:hypothetical protein